MRRPKAAIPILPPPDNQQSARGRGRSAQQYQHNNQPGVNVQQSEPQEPKNMVESDEKSVPGQFDSAQIELLSSVPSQEYPKNQAIVVDAVVTAVDDTNKSAERIVDVETRAKVDALPPAVQDDVDSSNSVKELLEITSNENNAVSRSSPTTTPATAAESEHELGNIESAISESTIVEKAAA